MSGRRGRAHALRSLGVAAMLAAFTPGISHAAGVLVLRSSDLPVYAATARALVDVAGIPGQSVAKIQLRANRLRSNLA